ncbi:MULTISPECIES: chromate transporter [unclassified Clostridium]|uniref:chromate transporter n=1 Tax=unclassified Clostridium TaxID=2614128 RepID=UPI00321734A7
MNYLNKNSKYKTCLWLFGVNFFISAFTFGGGYVVIPMIRKYFVEKKQYFGEEELLDMAAIAQSSPGAIAVNLSVLSGYRIAGFLGAVISCISAVLPPLIILSLISTCYSFFRDNATISSILKGMEAGVAALIVDLVVTMIQTVTKEKNALLSLMIPVVFIASFIFNINVMIILVSCIILCLIFKNKF